MNIKIIPAYDRLAEIRTLFSEYVDMRLAQNPDFTQCLQRQNYAEELLHLSEKYGAPTGCLCLATVDGEAAGCIGLRRLDDARCEMKRLFVRPQFRRHGLARRLVETSLTDAKKLGYQAVFLDTLPALESAVRLYRRLGFEETACYNNSPADSTLFMKRDL